MTSPIMASRSLSMTMGIINIRRNLVSKILAIIKVTRRKTMMTKAKEIVRRRTRKVVKRKRGNMRKEKI